MAEGHAEDVGASSNNARRSAGVGLAGPRVAMILVLRRRRIGTVLYAPVTGRNTWREAAN